MHGNLETGDNSTPVTAALRTGTGPLQGTTTVTVSGGIATFSNLADNTAETIILIFTGPGLAKATSNPITINSGTHPKVVRDVANVNLTTKVSETSQANHGRAIRGESLLATTRPHARLAATLRRRRSIGVPAGEASSIDADSIANRASAAVKADSAPVRVSAELKRNLAAYLLSLA